MDDSTIQSLCDMAMLASTLSEEELVELEILRDEEIDILINQGFLAKPERWNPELRNGFVFIYTEMILEITTRKRCPVEPLNYRLKNLSLPRIIIKTSDLENWNKRGTASSAGNFEFDTVVLYVVAKTITHLIQYRSDLANRLKSEESTIDESLAKQRMEMLEIMFYIGLSKEHNSCSTNEKICADRHRKKRLTFRRLKPKRL